MLKPFSSFKYCFGMFVFMREPLPLAGIIKKQLLSGMKLEYPCLSAVRIGFIID
jgi:hypothetical protein